MEEEIKDGEAEDGIWGMVEGGEAMKALLFCACFVAACQNKRGGNKPDVCHCTNWVNTVSPIGVAVHTYLFIFTHSNELAKISAIWKYNFRFAEILFIYLW